MGFITHLSFVQAVVLFPIGVVLHVSEEWPGFPRWARRFGSPKYSDREYLVTHTFAVVFAIGAVAIVRAFSTQSVVLFAFFAFVLGPGAFCNAWFHAGATAVTRTYCPGLVTGVLVYLPLSVILGVLALRDGVFTLPLLIAALIVAIVFHALEVGHNVFKRW